MLCPALYSPHDLLVAQSKMRRVKEYEAEKLELDRKTASGLWNKKLRPAAEADMEQAERDEIKKLTEAIRGQVRLNSRMRRTMFCSPEVSRILQMPLFVQGCH